MKRIELIALALLAFVLTACPTQDPPMAPKISSFTATPASLPAGGGDVTLAWSVSNAKKLSIDPGVGEVSGSQTTVRVSQSTTFTLTATGPGGSASKTASVSVAAPTEPSIEVSPASAKLRAGDPPQTFTATVRNSSAAVSWSLSGPGSLSATSGTSTQYTPPATLSGPASATLTASLSGTGKTAQADIALSPPPGWAQLGDRLNEGYRGSGGYIGAGTVPIVLDSSGNPWVAFHQVSGQVNNVFVRHWNGSAWQNVGSALNNNTAKNAFNPAMALAASGNPVVAFTETTTSGGSDTDNLYVKRWNLGLGKWEALGDLLNNPGKGVQESALALDGGGNPVVVWKEQASFYLAILVKRWNPSLEKWEALGTSPVGSGVNAGSLGVVVDSANRPVVAWHEPLTLNQFGVKAARFEEGSWKALGTLLNVSPSASASLPALALDRGVPVVAWSENTTEGNRVFVKRWNEAAGAWEGLGGSLAASPGRLALALDSGGNPWVAVQQYSVGVYRQAGDNWFPLGGDLGNSGGSAGFIALALDGGGNPVLAFDEFADPPGDRPWNVYVKRYTP